VVDAQAVGDRAAGSPVVGEVDVPAPVTAGSGAVWYGTSSIAFERVPADRSTLEISVLPDGRVIVKAPRDAGEEDVLHRVARRARWIVEQQRYFAQFEPRTPPRRYIGGETHLYLGRQYRLAIEAVGSDALTSDGQVENTAQPSRAPGVHLIGGWFRVRVVGEPTPKRVKRLMDDWYRDKARRRLEERLDVCWQQFPAAGRSRPNLRLRHMRTRWASLSASGTLSLRPDLMRAPLECIDYVILHELCHLVHADHGQAFRTLLERVLPDWERRKHRLELTLA
jgi:predicted metal-dependent hydrolase